MKLCRHEHDNISGKQIEYAIHMLVILAENVFHVVGFVIVTPWVVHMYMEIIHEL